MTATKAQDCEQYLTIALGGELFAIQVGLVRDILDVALITAVPTAPLFVGGLINVRGQVAPLADLCLRLGLPPGQRTINTRVVVIEIVVDGVATIVGILADKVYEVTRLDAVVTGEIPRIGMQWRPEFVCLLGKRRNEFVAVLDIDRIFSSSLQPEEPELREKSGARARIGS